MCVFLGGGRRRRGEGREGGREGFFFGGGEGVEGGKGEIFWGGKKRVTGGIENLKISADKK